MKTNQILQIYRNAKKFFAIQIHSVKKDYNRISTRKTRNIGRNEDRLKKPYLSVNIK